MNIHSRSCDNEMSSDELINIHYYCFGEMLPMGMWVCVKRPRSKGSMSNGRNLIGRMVEKKLIIFAFILKRY